MQLWVKFSIDAEESPRQRNLFDFLVRERGFLPRGRSELVARTPKKSRVTETRRRGQPIRVASRLSSSIAGVFARPASSNSRNSTILQESAASGAQFSAYPAPP